MYPYPYVKPSLLGSLKTIKWGSILDGTQKTLGVINQAIPVIYQVKPVVSNMKSMLKIANAIKEPEIKEVIKEEPKKQIITNNPVFYI